MPPPSVRRENNMDFLDNIYWKIKLFLSEWFVKKEDKINDAVARFKNWLDGN